MSNNLHGKQLCKTECLPRMGYGSPDKLPTGPQITTTDKGLHAFLISKHSLIQKKSMIKLFHPVMFYSRYAGENRLNVQAELHFPP